MLGAVMNFLGIGPVKKLMSENAELRGQVNELKSQMEWQEKVRQAALRRIHLLADKLGAMLSVEDVSTMQLSADGQAAIFTVGGNLRLTIVPFEDRFVLEDTTGKLQPFRCAFGEETDFDSDTVTRLRGFASFANTADDKDTPAAWATELSDPTITPATA